MTTQRVHTLSQQEAREALTERRFARATPESRPQWSAADREFFNKMAERWEKRTQYTYYKLPGLGAQPVDEHFLSGLEHSMLKTLASPNATVIDCVEALSRYAAVLELKADIHRGKGEYGKDVLRELGER